MTDDDVRPGEIHLVPPRVHLAPPPRIYVVPATQMPQGPDVVVDQPVSTRTIADRLRSPHFELPLTILVRVTTLNSPDQIVPLTAEVQGSRIVSEVEVRRFDGPLFANVQSVAVMELGPLSIPPGPAEVDITLRTLTFEVLDEPDRTASASISKAILPFTVPS